MSLQCLFSFLLIIISISSLTLAAKCPCSDASLCNNIKTNYTKELYGFIGGSGGRNNTSIYNWTYITALANKDIDTTGPGMDELMCTAHSHGVRMIYQNKAALPFKANKTAQLEWIENIFKNITNLHYDGITFDFEGKQKMTDAAAQQYVNLVNLTKQYFNENLPGSLLIHLLWNLLDQVKNPPIYTYIYIHHRGDSTT